MFNRNQKVMMSETAPSGFDGGAFVPNAEPGVAAQPDHSPHGNAGMTPEQFSEPMDDNRKEQLQQSTTQLEWYLAEKYGWATGQNGGTYLKPHDEYLNYVIERSCKAAEYGLGVCFPTDGTDTDEKRIVENMKTEVEALRSSLSALAELEGSSFERYIVERCLRAAVYATTTQYELRNWAARAAKQNQDASEHQNYGTKEARRDQFARTAGALFALIRENFPNADLSQVAFSKMAKRVIYDTARMEAQRLRSPEQLSADQQSSVDAALMVAETF